MNIIVYFKNDMCIPSNRYQRQTLFVVGVSVNWATVRRWQTKLLETWKVSQIQLQESVK